MITSFKELSMAGKIFTLAIPIIVTIGLAVRAADLARLDRIEERQFTMQGVAVTDQKLVQSEGKLVQLMDIRFIDTNSRIDVISKSQEKLLEVQQASSEVNKQILDELRRQRR
jgi:hypothetical protein